MRPIGVENFQLGSHPQAFYMPNWMGYVDIRPCPNRLAMLHLLKNAQKNWKGRLHGVQ